MKHMRTFGGWAGALLLGAAMATGCEEGQVPPTVVDGGRDVAGGGDGPGVGDGPGDVALEVDMAQPPEAGTCQAAQTLSDGQVLRNQDLSKGKPDASTSCKEAGSPSLFYQAIVYPLQHLNVQAINVSGGSPPLLLVREGCSDVSCRSDNGVNGYFNRDSVPRTVIIEATTSAGSAPPTFDLEVKMPLPPGEISVRFARGWTTSEAGGQASLEVVLRSPAVEPVDIPISSGDPAEGTVSPASLRFTADNWNTPQIVTVTGVDDSDRDGSRSYIVAVGPSTSPDQRYTGLSAGPVALINRDDEPGFSFEGPAVLPTSESGTRSTFKVVLNRAPTETVRLSLSSSDQGEGTVSPAELVFEPDSWNQPQTVTVTGIDDEERDGSQSYQVVIGAAPSADSQYQGLDPADVPARNADNDFERVAAQVVSGNLRCLNYGLQQLAADQARNLYAVMVCQAGGDGMVPPDTASVSNAFVAVSLDGGRSFGPPIDTGLSTSYVAVAAGAPGVALVAGNGPAGFAVVRSEDSGATWSKPMVLRDSAGGNIRMAAAGDRVLLGAHTELDYTFWLSEDSGRTFQSWGLTLDAGRVDLGLESDGTIWIAIWDGADALQFRTSSDGGRTFQSGRRVPGEYFRSVAAGPGLVFATGNELVVLPRDGSGGAQSIPIPTEGAITHRLVADERDNVVVLSVVLTGMNGGGSYGSIEASRLGSGETKLSTAKSIGAFNHGQSPCGVALSDNATAVLFSRAGQVSVAVETWP
jgi:hypothetical protein